MTFLKRREKIIGEFKCHWYLKESGKFSVEQKKDFVS